MLSQTKYPISRPSNIDYRQFKHMSARVVYDYRAALAWGDIYLLPNVTSKSFFEFFWLKCVKKPMLWVTEKELEPYSDGVQILCGIVRRFVCRFGHV
jgi:hypothetical protein